MVSHFHDCIHYNERAFFAELLERVRSLGRDIKTTKKKCHRISSCGFDV